MKIVITDAFLVDAGGVNWDRMREIGEVVRYDDSTPEELYERLADADAAFTNRCRFPAELIERCPRLKMIGTFGTGVNHIDGEAARRHGTAVCNVPGYGRGAVAQMAAALLFAIGRRAHEFDAWMKHTGWVNSVEPFAANLRQFEFTGKTVGIIGMGDIGYAFARICLAMDMKVLAFKRHPEPERFPGVTFADLDTLYAQSDVISLHCPLTPETAKMINRSSIAKMKDGVILINCGRGALFDTEAVAEGLDSGKIYMCGADVFDPEPCGTGHALAAHPRCIATPHVAWAPLETRQMLADRCAENLRCLLEGHPINVTN